MSQACNCDKEYIRRIRHAGKNGYARAVHLNLTAGKPLPDYKGYGLSPMGAQAVLLELAARHGDSIARKALGLPPIEAQQ